MNRRRIGIAVAALAPVMPARPLSSFVIEIQCDGCGEFPLWAQVLLTLIGLGIAMLILSIPVRLARRASTPRQRALIVWGGILFLTVGFVVLARVLVLVLPD